jgi:hypothetical protein
MKALKSALAKEVLSNPVNRCRLRSALALDHKNFYVQDFYSREVKARIVKVPKAG